MITPHSAHPQTPYQDNYTYHPASSQSTRQILDRNPTTPTPLNSSAPAQRAYSTSGSTSTSPITSTDNIPSELPFRPGQFIRRTSHNYAHAAFQARAKDNEDSRAKGISTVQGSAPGGKPTSTTGIVGDESGATSGASATTSGSESGGGVAGWKPSFTRKMSWDPQDLKREMQMRTTGTGGSERAKFGIGFTEK